MIEKPRTAVPNTDRSITLYFDFDEEKLLYPVGDFDMRGGICWPITYRVDGAVDSNGYIVVAGKNLETGVITIFEQQDFIVIEPIIDQDTMQITYKGISNFLNNAYANYFCNKYYFHQNLELTKKWRSDVFRCSAIKPKPSIVEIMWDDDRDADHVIFQLIKTRRLRQEKETALFRQLQELKLKPTGQREIYPAVRALQCVLMGFERYPLKRDLGFAL